MIYDKERIEKKGFHEFRTFLAHVWECIGLPPPTRTQMDIADYLQYGPSLSMIMAFRGVGKSFIACTFIDWNLMMNENLKNLILSATKMKADENSQFVKRLIMEIPLLHPLRPNKDGRTSSISFDVGPATIDQAPSVKSVGITGQIVGSRADIIIPDDIEIAKNSFTHLLREKLANQIKEFAAILKPLPTSRIIYLGTPQSEQSIYSRLPERGYEIRIWPAEIPSRPSVYMGRLAPFVNTMISEGVRPGTPVDPERFDEYQLQRRRQEYGRSGYPLQFLLDTTPSDQEKHPLHLKNLIVTDLDTSVASVKYVWGTERNGTGMSLEDLECAGFDGDRYYRPIYSADEMTAYTGSVMYIDPSGRGRDETSYAIVKHLYGQLFLLEVGGFKDGYGTETLQALAMAAQRHHVNEIVCEENFGGGMFTQLLTPVVLKLHRCSITDKHSTGQKELRIIDTLLPVTESHKLIVDRKVIEADLIVGREDPMFSWAFQMTRITRDKGSLPHDDRLEAIAGAVQFWVESMSRDTEKAHEDHLDEIRAEEMRQFIAGFDLFNPQSPQEDDNQWVRIP